MNIEVGLIAILLAAIAAAGPLLPLLHARAVPIVALADPLDDERRALLRELRELERDHGHGVFDEAAYASARARAERRAVDVLRQIADREGAGELAAAVRSRAVRSDVGPRSPIRVAVVGTAVSLAFALPLVAGVSLRAPGQLITGDAPPGAATDRAALAARVRARPDDVAARLDLAKLLLDEDDVRGATTQYLGVLERDPSNAEARTRLAYLVYLSGLADDALRALDRVLTDHPGHPEALFLRGLVLLRGMDRPREAALALRAYLETFPFGTYRGDAQALLSEAERRAR